MGMRRGFDDVGDLYRIKWVLLRFVLFCLTNSQQIFILLRGLTWQRLSGCGAINYGLTELITFLMNLLKNGVDDINLDEHLKRLLNDFLAVG